jgi:hypothetical protein
MLHEERVTYETLKLWALESYYDGCRDHAVAKGWQHEQIIGYVSYTFDEGFDRPIEDLMWRVILLVLSGGWHSDWDLRARQGITELIAKHSLEKLLVGVPEGEVDLFRLDLKILKLI